MSEKAPEIVEEKTKKVSDLVAEIRVKLGSEENPISQAALAERLNERHPKPKNRKDPLFVRPGDIQRLDHAGRNLEKQWLLFCKLYPMARDLNLFRLSYPADADHMKRHAEDFGPEFVEAFGDWLERGADEHTREKVIAVGKRLEQRHMGHPQKSRAKGAAKDRK